MTSATAIQVQPVSRRSFLQLTGVAAGALTLGFTAACTSAAAAEDVLLQPLLTITPDGDVILAIPVAEMGQGVGTALPLILAEEMDADWSRVRVIPFNTRHAVPDLPPGRFITANSHTVQGWHDPLRQCGAAARAMLVVAAAEKWEVEAADCTTARGHVVHPNGRWRLDYGFLAAAAAKKPVPAELSFKDAADYKLVGRTPGRLDVTAKATGRATYAIDVRLPDMLFASVRQGPVSGASLTGFDKPAAMAVPGVRDVFAIGDGDALAVVATNSWSAMQGLDAASPQFALSPDAMRDSSAYYASLPAALARPGLPTGEQPFTPIGGATASAVYEVPFLAHVTMEPMSCTARFEDGTLEIWTGTQMPFIVQSALMGKLDLPADRVIVHQTLLGGGFGRRAEADFVFQAVEIAQRTGKPVNLVWSRPEDMQQDFYRPACAIRCEARLDQDGRLAAWRSKIAGGSIQRSRGSLKDGVADSLVGQSLLPEVYDVPDSRGAWVEVQPPLPLGFWRSVGHSHNVFAVECFMDELAVQRGEDPLAYRLRLANSERARAVLKRAAKLGNWDAPLEAGRGRGVALAHCYGSFIATIIEASVEDGAIRLHGITNVIDCGLAIQPENVVAQVEGGCLFGLSAALHGEITVRDGAVEQQSFPDHQVLALADVPEMRTKIIRSAEPPAGVGETATPTAAPALANALFAATGRRLRRLPLAPGFAA